MSHSDHPNHPDGSAGPTASPLRRVALAINPTSGKGRGLRAGIVAAVRLRAAGVEVDELIGKDADDLKGQIRHAVHQAKSGTSPGIDALIAVGGDGMVQLAVTEVAGTTVPLGIVPAGTGNDVARALHLPIADPIAATDVVLTNHRRRIDAVHITDDAGTDQTPEPRWFAGVLGAGFDAVVNERANRWTRPRGTSRYVLAMLRELPVFRPRSYTITLDGEPWQSAAMLVAVANGPSYGGGMRVCPDAAMDDGLLDVMLVQPLSRARLLTIFPRVYSGTHVSDRRVIIRRARTVTVAAAGIVAYADGERIGPLPLTLRVVPGAVEMLAP